MFCILFPIQSPVCFGTQKSHHPTRCSEHISRSRLLSLQNSERRLHVEHHVYVFSLSESPIRKERRRIAILTILSKLAILFALWMQLLCMCSDEFLCVFNSNCSMTATLILAVWRGSIFSPSKRLIVGNFITIRW